MCCWMAARGSDFLIRGLSSAHWVDLSARVVQFCGVWPSLWLRCAVLAGVLP